MGHTIRRGACRGHDRALRGLGLAFGNGRRWRRARLTCDRRHVWYLAPFAADADPDWHYARKLDVVADRGLLAPLCLCDELSAHITKRGGLADLAWAFEMGAARVGAGADRHARFFPASRLDHPH